MLMHVLSKTILERSNDILTTYDDEKPAWGKGDWETLVYVTTDYGT